MPSSNLPRFDELYVVSDIHMGGEPGFQILREGPRLGAFIRHVAAVRPGERVCLVLNGDVIDSLAEPAIDGYIAARNAEAMMARIYADPTFEPVWSGLAEFVRAPGRHLVIAVGNHDIELALPGVMRSVREHVTGGDAAADAALQFATHGEGFSCMVGGSRVFCTHGNEVDAFNSVDFDQLAQLGNALNAAREPDMAKWEPNAGTRIVIDVMNRIKRQHPFIDLLKPETKAAVGVLAVLAPDELGRSLWRRQTVDIAKSWHTGSRRVSDLLSASGAEASEVVPPHQGAELLADAFLGENLKQVVGGAVRTPAGEDMLLQVERDLHAGRAPPDGEDVEAGTLGAFDGTIRLFVDLITGAPKEEALRAALKDWLAGDDTFELTTRDGTFEQIVPRVGPEVHFIVTGHTHLQRAIPFGAGNNRYYYNCGTWIRLLRFTPEVLDQAHEADFHALYQVLASGRMEDIDAAEIPGKDGARVKLVMEKRSTAVRISADASGAAAGDLLHVSKPDNEGNVTLHLVPGSHFTRS